MGTHSVSSTPFDKAITTYSLMISNLVSVPRVLRSISWFTFPVDIQAQAMVDAAYQDREGWIKKSISTSAKVSISNRSNLHTETHCTLRWASSAQIVQSWTTPRSTGTSSRARSRRVRCCVRVLYSYKNLYRAHARNGKTLQQYQDRSVKKEQRTEWNLWGIWGIYETIPMQERRENITGHCH